MLCAAAVCTFSTFQLRKVTRGYPRFLMCLASQWHAISDLFYDQMSVHPLLQRVYFPTLRGHSKLKRQGVSRLFYLFANLDLLSSSFLFSDLLSSFSSPSSVFHLSIYGLNLTLQLPSYSLLWKINVFKNGKSMNWMDILNCDVLNYQRVSEL